MDTENSKTSETHKFRFYLTVKIDFKNSNKNIALVNVSIYLHMKKQMFTITVNLKCLLLHGIMSFNCLMDHTDVCYRRSRLS